MNIYKNKKIIHLHGYQPKRSTYHTTLQATPCQLVIGRDMIHNIAFKKNWDQMQKTKQEIIRKYNRRKKESYAL
jgi:hypothetical protein